MQLVFHVGLHRTDEDRILKCLLKNRGDFADEGTLVPPPGRYRKLIGETVAALSKAQPAPDAREILLDTILEGEAADRLLLSNQNFFSFPKFAASNGVFYHKAVTRVGQLKQLFAGDQIELFFALRDPASFLPALFEKAPVDDFVEMTSGVDPRDLRWSELVARLREAHPDVPLTIWCNEDSPLIWAQIIREMAGIEPGRKIQGGFDLLAEIMTREGMKRFRAYLKDRPVMTEIQKRRVMVAFLDKFAREDMIEEELDLPGWTEELVDELSEIYEEDIYEIARMPGVNFIQP
ncbi:hypothetical protein RXV86_17085 [Alisedimentitalea sp. MJ-SS2]|uniref:hypothetical protein n=1 Tax=Aliisedimentitalea sp. MJ-SS2 TaxID=3049795 RepID=UPI0029068401|nr:hypothetical protein [Alisedimentitalea sp. MJ-SS2]MDU8929111.1 hypothetical protein [Alisedimentitalea sp. MJ-SS2]